MPLGRMCGVDVVWGIGDHLLGVKAAMVSGTELLETIMLGDVQELFPCCQSLAPFVVFEKVCFECRLCEPAVESRSIQ